MHSHLLCVWQTNWRVDPTQCSFSSMSLWFKSNAVHSGLSSRVFYYLNAYKPQTTYMVCMDWFVGFWALTISSVITDHDLRAQQRIRLYNLRLITGLRRHKVKAEVITENWIIGFVGRCVNNYIVLVRLGLWFVDNNNKYI